MPAEQNSFSWIRWLNISLRTLHLIGVSGMGGMFIFDLPEETWLPYLIITSGSGLIMMLLETWSNPGWLLQLRGLSMLLKLLILLSSFYFGANLSILIAAIIISGVISHAPGKVRYYTPFNLSS